MILLQTSSFLAINLLYSFLTSPEPVLLIGLKPSRTGFHHHRHLLLLLLHLCCFGVLIQKKNRIRVCQGFRSMEKACWNNSPTTGACFPCEFRFCSFDDMMMLLLSASDHDYGSKMMDVVQRRSRGEDTSGKYLCVCVCVCEREREREKELSEETWWGNCVDSEHRRRAGGRGGRY